MNDERGHTDTQGASRPDAGVGPASSAFTSLKDWPVDRSVYLTLDLECDYGTALAENHYHAAERTADLAAILADRDLPLTCFLQTAVLEEVPQAVDDLRYGAASVEFHPHSHTHPARSHADARYEVSTSTELVREQFDTDPLGYRFPDGAAYAEDYALLEEHDIAFDASLFPTFRPGRFNNLSSGVVPKRHIETGVIELPFSVYSPIIRIPVGLSYLKVFGRLFEQLVLHRPPSVIVFNIHMHDMVVPPSYDDLDTRYRLAYSRRAHEGFDIFRRFVRRMQSHGYEFGTMTDLYEAALVALE